MTDDFLIVPPQTGGVAEAARRGVALLRDPDQHAVLCHPDAVPAVTDAVAGAVRVIGTRLLAPDNIMVVGQAYLAEAAAATQAATGQFVCPRCLRPSAHPTDRQQGYCGACHDWTGTPEQETTRG